MMDTLGIALLIGKIVVIYVTVLTIVPFLTWAERRGAALIQDRPGPNRVGPFGLFQPFADFVKFIWKEDPIPANVNSVLYVLGPFLALIPASLVLAVLPLGDGLFILGRVVPLQIAEIEVGLLFVLAVGSLGIYGILFGGWASNNKFSLLGAMRSSSQIISYEIPYGLAAVGAVMIYGSFSLREITMKQEGLLWGVLPNWGVFYQPLGFLLFFIAAFAETNRLPFDLPETEAELVAGYHTEYGSMKFATFFLAEYVNLITASALLVTLYFGGWHVPYLADSRLLGWLGGSRNWLGLIQVAVFLTKVLGFIGIFIWVRWTIPRFRFDQLMRLAWKCLIPWGLANLAFTAILLYWWGRG